MDAEMEMALISDSAAKMHPPTTISRFLIT
jgi:hypothetical protein